MQQPASWYCDSRLPDPGNGCSAHTRPPNGINRFADRLTCEAHCLVNANFNSLARAVAISGINYPFNDELRQLAAEQGDGAISAEYRKAMIDGAAGLVSKLFNTKHGADYYMSLPNVTQIPRLFLNFVQVTAQNEHLFAEYCADLYNEQDAAGRVAQQFCERVAKARSMIKKTPGPGVYILVQDPNFAIESGVEQKPEDEFLKYGNWLVHHYLDKYIGIGKQTIWPIQLQGIGGSHANALYISHNGKSGQAVLLEPHVSAEWGYAVDEAIPQVLSNVFEHYNIKYTSLESFASCGRGLQSTMFHDYGSCLTWKGLMAATYALNPQIDQKIVLEQILSAKNNSTIFLNLFIFHVYRRTIKGEFGNLGRLEAMAKEAKENELKYIEKSIAEETDPVIIALLNGIALRDSWFWLWSPTTNALSNFIGEIVFNKSNALNTLHDDLGHIKLLLDVPAWITVARAVFAKTVPGNFIETMLRLSKI